jgi:hypothetical protein
MPNQSVGRFRLILNGFVWWRPPPHDCGVNIVQQGPFSGMAEISNIPDVHMNGKWPRLITTPKLAGGRVTSNQRQPTTPTGFGRHSVHRPRLVDNGINNKLGGVTTSFWIKVQVDKR